MIECFFSFDTASTDHEQALHICKAEFIPIPMLIKY